MKNGPIYGFWSVAHKETLHMRRDVTTLIFALVTPMIQLTLFGYALNFDVRHIATVVVDFDRSAESRRYLQQLHNTQYIDIVKYVDTVPEAEDMLRSTSAHVAVIIPPDFAQRYGTGNPPQVGVLLDGADSQVASPVRAAFGELPAMSSDATPASGVSAEGTAPVQPRVTVLFNPDMRTAVNTIPGLIAVILQLVTVTLTAFSLVRERELGTLDQLMVSPVSRLGLLLGKLAPYLALATFELFWVVLAGHTFFNVPFAGSFWLLVALSIPFILASLSIGLLISTFAQNQAQAMQMTMLTVMPSILISGYITPRETLPGALYILSCIFPVTHFMQIVRGIMVRGATLSDVAPSVGALLLITVILLTAATLRFRKTMD